MTIGYLLAYQIQNLSCVKESCSFREALVHPIIHCYTNLGHILILVVLVTVFSWPRHFFAPKMFLF